MLTYLKAPSKLKAISLGVFLFSLTNSVFAAVVITGNNNINTPTSYNNTVLDMSNGRFTINTGGSLSIQNSTINITVSPSNPFFASLMNGSLVLKNDTVNVTVSGITPNPNAQSLYPLINVQTGSINLLGNKLTATTPFAVSVLQTNSQPTTGFNISNNLFYNFHGGLYLNNSSNAVVNNNIFSKVSFSNIYNSGSLNAYNNNTFLFPGNLAMGDAFDIINSNGANITNNLISSGTNYGIFIMGGQNVSIDNNEITDCLSYGIYIQTPSSSGSEKNKYLAQLLPKKTIVKNKAPSLTNNNISIINNYIEQNRYGLAGGVVNQLLVTNNIFIQRFNDSSVRQEWTNNDVLLPYANNMIWLNNLYKEAFSQDVPGDNSNSLRYVPFPESGGVNLP